LLSACSSVCKQRYMCSDTMVGRQWSARASLHAFSPGRQTPKVHVCLLMFCMHEVRPPLARMQTHLCPDQNLTLPTPPLCVHVLVSVVCQPPAYTQIGCMGYNARPGPIALTIEAFRDGLKQQGRA
jgi:hypothetical protein